MAIIDLRSDTVTRPTRAMREAMLDAPVGDDVYGEDPTVNALQERLAAELGFQAGLFVPSGTQSNLLGLMAHCERGDEYLVGADAHTYKFEGGGAAVLGSIQPQPIAHQSDGSLAVADLEAAVKPVDPHFARTRLLALENTWHGRALPQDAHARRVEGGDERGTNPGRQQQVLDPMPHLRGGLVGEGDREHVPRVDALHRQEVGDPVGDDAGLAAPRPGQDEHRALRGRDRLALRRVQGREETVRGHRRVRHGNKR